MGNLIAKKAVNVNGSTETSYYFRDAQGNPKAIYTHKNIDNHGKEEQILALYEREIYGSSRIGRKAVNRIIASSDTSLISTINPMHVVVGDKRYELSNHLGNVLEVRYGFNGMQKYDEIKEQGESYTIAGRFIENNTNVAVVVRSCENSSILVNTSFKSAGDFTVRFIAPYENVSITFLSLGGVWSASPSNNDSQNAESIKNYAIYTPPVILNTEFVGGTATPTGGLSLEDQGSISRIANILNANPGAGVDITGNTWPAGGVRVTAGTPVGGGGGFPTFGALATGRANMFRDVLTAAPYNVNPTQITTGIGNLNSGASNVTTRITGAGGSPPNNGNRIDGL